MNPFLNEEGFIPCSDFMGRSRRHIDGELCRVCKMLFLTFFGALPPRLRRASSEPTRSADLGQSVNAFLHKVVGLL